VQPSSPIFAYPRFPEGRDPPPPVEVGEEVPLLQAECFDHGAERTPGEAIEERPPIVAFLDRKALLAAVVVRRAERDEVAVSRPDAFEPVEDTIYRPLTHEQPPSRDGGAPGVPAVVRGGLSELRRISRAWARSAV
jgi:hypothetical protein